MRRLPPLCLLVLAMPACADAGRQPRPATPLQREVQAFLERYSARYQELATAWNEAEWQANVRIEAGDDSRVRAAQAARAAYARFTGAEEVLQSARRFAERRGELLPLQARQLDRILYLGAGNPERAADAVAALIEHEGPHIQKLYGFEFRIDGEAVTPNDIDRILRESRDLEQRRKAWEASKEVGPPLAGSLARLVELRNAVVAPSGYPSYWAYQVADYGMTPEEMRALLERVLEEIRPLYRELHAWARRELAARYGQPVPERIPAHWLPNRWAQDWSALVEVEGADLDAALAGRSAEWVVRQGEEFYVSMGFPPLPASFWTRSSLYPVPLDAGYKKNTHASAWHIDLARDVRSLMSVEPNAEWYETVHHELGHVYYYLSYSRPGVPVLLRDGANRAFHEAVGSLLGFAAMQRPFLAARGLAEPGAAGDMRLLLREALAQVVFLPFSIGTMSGFEEALYTGGLRPEDYNRVWWELAARHQGIEPPGPRGSGYADGLSKTHLHDDAAQYYDYALSNLILFQLHDHIARRILRQDPRATNYHGSRAAGAFLRSILEAGNTRDWREVLEEATGEGLSAQPMLRYFAPLLQWLRDQNRS